MALLLAGGVLGAGTGRLLRLPMWPMTGALLGAAVVHNLAGGATNVPAGWSILAQVLVGAAVGATITPGVVAQFRAVLLPGLLAVVSMIGVGIVCGLGIAATGQVDSVAAVFGMVPGGVGEMVAAATALNGDSALVAGMHVTRLVLVLGTLPLVIGWTVRLAGGRGDEG
ncbi:MAG: AbrB family transcriptional regulator [Nocardioidaceae bacterium]